MLFFSLIITLSIICKNQLVVAIPIEDLKCSFEKTKYCSGWENVSSPWYYGSYEQPTTNPLTGPQQRYGKEGNYYVYVLPINSTNTEPIATLKSLNITVNPNTNGLTCFRFWYYMYGEHVQNLTVTSDKGEVYFRESGNKNTTWHCGIFDASGISGRKIIFNIYRTTLPYSVIAIDHIEIISSNGCSQQNCESIVTITTSMTVVSTTSLKTTTYSVTTKETEGTNDPIIAQLPIVIGVPCGVLLVGSLIVGLAIYKKRHSTESTGQSDDESVYHELDDNNIVENNVYIDTVHCDEINIVDNNGYIDPVHSDEINIVDNNGYIDPVYFDEIKDVTLRRDGSAHYATQS